VRHPSFAHHPTTARTLFKRLVRQFFPDHAQKVGPALPFVVGAQFRFDMLRHPVSWRARTMARALASAAAGETSAALMLAMILPSQ
jgi:hypothetical protein